MSLDPANTPADPRGDDATERLAPRATRLPGDWRAGDWVAHYRVESLLGSGGQGAVYLAEDTRLHRKVALKVLSHVGPLDEETRRRFQREAEVASRLDHAGLCTVFDSGVVGSTPYIAMRYVRGQTLARELAARRHATNASTFVDVEGDGGAASAETVHTSSPGGGAQSPARGDIVHAVALIEKAARALHAAHEAGVVHRDIKPGNIMITDEGEPVLLDFGLARDLWATDATLTQVGDLFGTPAYMSPEQVTASTALDRRTDVYSLGATLFECLTGRPPFASPTRAGLFQAIVREPAADPRLSNVAIPSDLSVVVLTALAKDRDRRYQTALALAEDLARVRRREPIFARPVGPVTRVVSWSRRNPALAAALVALFVVLSAGLLATWHLLEVARAERDDAQSARDAKEEARRRADANASLASAALADYERLADMKRLADLRREAEDLWPAVPERIAGFEDWLRRARTLALGLRAHRASLQQLRLRAESRGAAESSPLAFVFGRTEDQWKHDYLAELVSTLEAFVDRDPTRGVLADVERRLAYARTVTDRSITQHRAEWEAAQKSIADPNACPRYGGIHLAPQVGLIPIRRDPRSGLWEFADLATTAVAHPPIPTVDADGRYDLREETGIVWVLVPGGTCVVGARIPDDEHPPGSPNVDPAATEDEGPPNQVSLAPFFLSKYEMTQGQWLRATGKNPSAYAAGLNAGRVEFTLLHPVDSVTHRSATRVLRQLGCRLPTEAQWEYAARAGTTTPWWTGADRESLRRDGVAANLADRAAVRAGAQWPATTSWPDFDDGFPVHAPIGSTRANPFGLHEIHGNVMELTREPLARYAQQAASGPEGLRLAPEAQGVGTRGGSFTFGADYARVSFRYTCAPDYQSDDVGVRPMRPIQGDVTR